MTSRDRAGSRGSADRGGLSGAGGRAGGHARGGAASQPAPGMAMAASVGLDVAHKHVLAPVAVQVLALLRLPQAELEDVVAARIAANPLLRQEEPRRCPWCASRLRDGWCRACASGRASSPSTEGAGAAPAPPPPTSTPAAGAPDRSGPAGPRGWLPARRPGTTADRAGTGAGAVPGAARSRASAGTTSDAPGDRGWDPSAPESEIEELRREARLVARRDLAPVVDAVIDALDDRGLLTIDVEGLAAVVGASAEDVAAAVTAVRIAGPPGIAARTSVECLEAQARWHAERGGPAALAPIVAHHLEQVADGDHAAIARALRIDAREVDEAVAFLRRHLRPSATVGSHPTAADPMADAARPQPPDVIVRHHPRRPGRLLVDVLDSRDTGLVIDTDHLGDRAGGGAAAAWIADRLADATSLLDTLDRRAATLRRVAAAIVAAQYRFVVGGADDHVPLTRTQVAETLGLHVSTVSRAVGGGKVARLPDGRLVPLATFFEPAVAAKAALGRLLQGGHASRSDAELATLLAASGYPMARRTVTKYRHALATRG